MIASQGTYLNAQNVLIDFFCLGELPGFILDYSNVQSREESTAIVRTKSSTHGLRNRPIKIFRFIVLVFLLKDDAEVIHGGKRILVLGTENTSLNIDGGAKKRLRIGIAFFTSDNRSELFHCSQSLRIFGA